MTEMNESRRRAVAFGNAIFNAILRTMDSREQADRRLRFEEYEEIRLELIDTIEKVQGK